jgi:hypothetical protein
MWLNTQFDVMGHILAPDNTHSTPDLKMAFDMFEWLGLLAVEPRLQSKPLWKFLQPFCSHLYSHDSPSSITLT